MILAPQLGTTRNKAPLYFESGDQKRCAGRYELFLDAYKRLGGFR